MKKLIIIAICLMAIFSSNIMAKTAGEKLQDLQIINGDETGNLSEEKPLTRAQLAVILCQLNQVKDEAEQFTESMGFSDVADNQWYAPYVNYCKNKGWLNGASQTTFNPNGFVSEEMIAIVLERVLGHEPVWGQAKEVAEQLGMYVDVQDETKVLRGEVFNYMYQALFVEKKPTNTMLYETLNIDIRPAYSHVIGELFTEDYELEYYDIYGQNLKNDVQLSLDESSTPVEFTQHIDGQTLTYNFRYNDDYIAQEGDIKTIQSIQRSAFGRKAKKYEVNSLTPEYIILSEKREGYIMRDYLYDWEGQLIELPNSSANHFISVFENGYVIVEEWSSNYTKRKAAYLYNVNTQTKEEDIYPYNYVQKIDEDTWLYEYIEDTSVEMGKIVNKKNGEEQLLDFSDEEDGLHRLLDWKYGSKYGQLMYFSMDDEEVIDFYGSQMINLAGEVVLETDYYVADIAFFENESFIVLDMDNNYGVMDINGDMVLDIVYEDIYKYSDGDLWLTQKDGEEFFYTLSGQTMTVNEKMESEKIIYMLPNNKKLITYDNYYGPSQLQDLSGNVLKEFGSVFEVVYNPSQNVLIGEFDIYTLDGERLAISDQYDFFSDFSNDFICATKDNTTYIIDLEGNIILGPYEGEFEFE